MRRLSSGSLTEFARQARCSRRSELLAWASVRECHPAELAPSTRHAPAVTATWTAAYRVKVLRHLFIVGAIVASLVLALGSRSIGAASARITSDLPAHEVARTFSDWRQHVGHGPITSTTKAALMRRAIGNVNRVRARVKRVEVFGGTNGPAIYLDLVTRHPVWTLRHARPLVLALARAPYSGGWAIRLRERSGGTVWIAGNAGTWGFVWSRPDLDAFSPVAHG